MVSDIPLGPLKDLLSPLPIELLDIVIDHLPRDDILTCLRVNSIFFSAIRPRMCSRLQFRPDPKHGLVCFGVQESADLVTTGSATKGLEVHPLTLTRKWIPSFVRYLEVLPHELTDCEHFCGLGDSQSKGQKERASPSPAAISASVIRLKVSSDNYMVHPLNPYRGFSEGPAECETFFDLCSPRTLVVPVLRPFYLTYFHSSTITEAVYILTSTAVYNDGISFAPLFFKLYHLRAMSDVVVVFAAPSSSSWVAPVSSVGIWSDFEIQRELDRRQCLLVEGFVRSVLDVRYPPRLVRLTLVHTGKLLNLNTTFAKAPNDIRPEDSVGQSLVDHAMSIVQQPLGDELGLHTEDDFRKMFRAMTLQDYIASAPGVLLPEDYESWK